MRRYPLRIHLVVLVAGALLPVLLFAGFLTKRVVDDERAELQRRVLESARTQMQVVEGEIAGSVRALQTLAQSSRIDAGDFASFYEQASRVLRGQPWDSIVLSDAGGQQIVNTAIPWGTPLPRTVDTESFDRIQQTRAPVVGNLFRDDAGALAFRIRVPVQRGDRPPYVLTARLTADSLTPLLHDQAPAADEWVRSILDGAGTIVARSRNPETTIGGQGTPEGLQRLRTLREDVFQTTTREGMPVYAAFTHGALSGWAAAVAVPVAVVDAPFRQSMTLLAIGGIALLGVGIAAALIVGTRISRSIDGTARAAAALARGEAVAVPETGVAEIASVAASLRESSALLRAHAAERDAHLAQADAARNEAEAADRAKDDFLAMLGHELRNPLAPALTALQLMRMRGDTGLQREREVLERQVRHLARLVDDLLDVSRVRRGRIELRRAGVELDGPIRKGIELAQPLITERGHRLTVAVPADGLGVDGDETRLAQIVANLLTNAAKYSSGPGNIELRAFADGDDAVIEVHDDGIGIAPELLPRIFDLFVQGERMLDRNEGGLGLGLPLARTLAQLHGGSITAASPGAGQGSTFTVRLPRAAVPAAPLPAAVAPAASLGPMRVLVVDDNRDALEMMAAALRFEGLEVETAIDGAEALTRARSFAPDAAVLDIGLPRMDGLELARRLRAAAAGRPLRLIALTGYGQKADISAASAAGFDLHLVKPASTEVIVEALRPAAGV